MSVTTIILTVWRAFQVRVQQMLPIEDLDHNEVDGYTASFEMEPSRDAILEQLLPQYAESMIYGAILDAKQLESAGMTAMQHKLTMPKCHCRFNN